MDDPKEILLGFSITNEKKLRVVFRTQSNIYGGEFFQIIKHCYLLSIFAKSIFIDV